MNLRKRAVALALAAVMLLGAVPFSAFAEEAGETLPVSTEETVAPTAEETVPETEETAPSTEETVPQTEETVSQTEETVPGTEETAAPETEETVSGTEETTSATEETVSETVEETTANEVQEDEPAEEFVTESFEGFQDLPDNDELFAGYTEMAFMPYPVSTFGTTWRERLTPEEQDWYDALKPFLQDVAAGRISYTVFEGLPGRTFTKKELGLSTLVANGAITEEAKRAVSDRLNLQGISDAVHRDMPYECYWIKKGQNMLMGYSLSASKGKIAVSGVTLILGVAGAYGKPGGMMENGLPVETDINKTAGPLRAAEEAKRVAAQYAGLGDLQKLHAFNKYICDRVSYDHRAAAAGTTQGIENAWQLIYAFDPLQKNPMIVCEGYSKAFQYLCDLSTFRGYVVCDQEIGDLGRPNAGHMWNKVTLDGVDLLVDITNSDAGTVGQDGSLFLATIDKSKPDDGGRTAVYAGGVKFICDYTDTYARTANMLSQVDLTIPAPAAGETPTSELSGTGYEASISWSPVPANGVFEEGVTYSASVLLQPTESPFSDNLAVTINGQTVPFVDSGIGLRRQGSYEFAGPGQDFAANGTGFNLQLTDMLGANIYVVPNPGRTFAPADYILFTMPDGRTLKQTVAEAAIVEGEYVFTCPVAAKEMTDEILAQMYVAGKPDWSYTFSIENYVSIIMEYNPDAQTVELLRSMLNYGTAAQIAFQYHMDALANRNVTDTAIRAGQGVFDSYAYESRNKATGISHYSSSLNLVSSLEVLHYFKLEPGCDISSYRFVLLQNGKVTGTLTPEFSDGMYRVKVGPIYASALGGRHTLRITNVSDGSRMEVDFSPLTYCYLMATRTMSTHPMNELVRTLYDYYRAAAALAALY